MKKIFTILLVSCCLVSCRKFLEEYSSSDLTPKSAADFGEILYADGYPDTRHTMHPWMVFLDDDTQCYVTTVNAPYVGSNLALIKNVYQWQSDFAGGSGSISASDINGWAAYYKLLLGVNVVLQNIDNSIGSQDERDQFKGEAYGLRAFYHFMLVNMYARPYNDSLTTPDKSAGIPLRLNANLSDAYLTRNTVKEVYQQIVSDLDSSLILLNKKKSNNDVFRLSHVAVHLLASRVYLFMEDWQKSIEHADAVLRYHPQLMDYRDWVDNLPSDTRQLIGPDNKESLWCYGHNAEQYPTFAGYAMCFEVSRDLYNCFEDNDLRKTVALYLIPEYLKEYVAIDFQQLKHADMLATREAVNNSWRSSEAYLNRAEAYIQLYRTKGDAGAAAEALKSLNTLRAGRFDPSTFQPWTLLPGNTLLEMCRNERRRELFREEAHRWFDLRRYGMPEIKHRYIPQPGTLEIYTLKKRDPQYVIPIPEIVLTQNPALTRNPFIPGIRQPD